MLTSLQISGYRAFSSFVVEPFASVNVLVGPNNAGKTSLLEAIRLIASGGSPSALLASALTRGEYEVETDDSGRRRRTAQLAFQLHGYTPIAGQSFRMRAEYSDDTTRSIEATVFDAASLDPDADVFVHPSESDARSPYGFRAEGVFPEWALEIALQLGERQHSYNVPCSWSLAAAQRLRKMRAPPAFPDARSASILPILLSTDVNVEQAILQAWDRIEATERKAWVIESLQVIAPEVVDIGMQSDASLPLASRIVLRLRKPAETRIPAGTLGEGTRRLLVLLIALAATPGQVLLVDDIDIGLHHRTLDAMWRLLLDACPRFGIQLFATTHSIDCLSSLARVAAEEQSWMSQVRVHRVLAQHERSIAYDASQLELAIRTLWARTTKGICADDSPTRTNVCGMVS